MKKLFKVDTLQKSVNLKKLTSRRITTTYLAHVINDRKESIYVQIASPLFEWILLEPREMASSYRVKISELREY